MDIRKCHFVEKSVVTFFSQCFCVGNIAFRGVDLKLNLLFIFVYFVFSVERGQFPALTE